MKRGALTPQQYLEQCRVDVPEHVLEAVNALLCATPRKQLDERSFSVLIKSSSIQSAVMTRSGTFESDWWEFPRAYRARGWEVRVHANSTGGRLYEFIGTK